MKKFLFILPLFIFFLISLAPTHVHAAPNSNANCNIVTNPEKVSPATKKVSAKIQNVVGMQAGTYYVKFQGRVMGYGGGNVLQNQTDYKLEYQNNQGIIPAFNHEGKFTEDSGNFGPGSYTIAIINTPNSGDNQIVCSSTIVVDNSISYGSCQITFKKPLMTYQDPVDFNISGFTDDQTNGSGYHIELHTGSGTTDSTKINPDQESSSKQGVNKDYSYGLRSAGTWSIVVRRGCDYLLGGYGCDSDSPLCVQSFCIGTETDGKNSCGDTSTLFTPQNIRFIGQDGKPIEAPSIPCAKEQLVTDKKGGISCGSVATGLGFAIPTDAPGFAAAVMGLILGIAGVILLLIVIITGYRLMTSQGDPEKIKAAREQLTGAITGIVFIIFSIAALSLIGISILHIPGFK